MRTSWWCSSRRRRSCSSCSWCDSGSCAAKYSVLWLSIGGLLAVLALFPNLLVPLSNALGIDYPPATFMLLAVSFLLVLVLHFSWEISRLEDRTRALAEEHALLRELVLSRDALGPSEVSDPAPDARRR